MNKLYCFFIMFTVIHSASIVFSEEDMIYEPPIIYNNSTTRSLVVKEGHKVKLYCFAGGVPTPTVSWRRDGLIYNDNVLSIINVRKRNGGVYVCVAENGLGENTFRRVHITVQYYPITTVLHRYIFVAIEHDTKLDCLAEAYPSPSIIWMKDGIQLQSDNVLHNISGGTTTNGHVYSSLHVIMHEANQFGKYICLAKNDIGTTEAVVYVTQLH